MQAQPDRLVFIPSHRCKQRLPGSGRDLAQNEPDAAAGSQSAWGAFGNERPLWFMGYPNLYRGADP